MTPEFADLFVEVADTLVAEFDLFDFLHTIADNAASISGAKAVGLVLSDQQGKLRYAAASNESGAALELFQVTSAEGPCQDCFRDRDQVVSGDLRQHATVWPAFVSQALEVGIQSVHAFPMRAHDRVIGALNVFDDQPALLPDDTIRMIQALANIATISLLHLQALTERDTLADQLQSALTSRVVIEQAKGILANRDDLTMEQAFSALRAESRRRHLRIAQAAAEIVHDH